MLAVLGGSPAVETPHPHQTWPPEASATELEELAAQRNEDINIKGRTGPIEEFEDAFLEFMEGGTRYAVTFNSGTSALLAAYMAVGVREGRDVVGPVLTYHAALSPVHVLGGRVILADVERGSRCISPADVEARLTENTVAITVVHQWGHPCDMDALLGVARRHGLYVIEDCSHAHGSRYKGRLCGTFGDAAVFSLQAKKAVFAGEGGVLVTNDTEIHDRVLLAGHYRDRSRDEVRDPGLHRYWETGFGLKLRMSPFNAIVAKHSLARFPEVARQRQRCLNHFNERLREVDYIDPMNVSGDVEMGAWYGFKPLYRPERLGGIRRATLIEALRAEGVDVRAPSGGRLSVLPLYTEYAPGAGSIGATPVGRGGVGSFPNAAYIEAHALSLPTFWQPVPGLHVIDEYVAAMKKLARHADQLLDYEREN